MNLQIIPQAYLDQAGTLQRSYAIKVNGFPRCVFYSEHEVRHFIDSVRGNKQ